MARRGSMKITPMARAFFRHYEHKHRMMDAYLAELANTNAGKIDLPANLALLTDAGIHLIDSDGSYLVTGAA